MNRCTRRIGVMLWVAIGTGPSPASFAAAPFKRFDRLSEDFGHARELLRVPGLAATVVQDGRVVWHQEFGMADRLKLSSLARRQLEGDLKIAKALAHLHIGQMPRATAGVSKAVESSVDVLARAVGRALIESDYGKCGTCNRGAASEAATRALFSCHLLPAEQSERSCNRALRADRWDSAAVGTLVNVPGVGRIRKMVSRSRSTARQGLSGASRRPRLQSGRSTRYRQGLVEATQGWLTSRPPRSHSSPATVTVASVKKFQRQRPPTTFPPSSVLSPSERRTTPAPYP